MLSLPAPGALLLAFDLDGTLIADGGLTVPDSTRAALSRLRGLGVRVAIITGRDQPPPDVLDAAQPDAVAVNNGGTISVGGRLHREALFSEDELRAVLAHSLEGARVIAFTRTRVYIDAPPGTPVPAWLARREHAPLSQLLQDRADILKIGFYHPGIRTWRDALSASHPQLVMTGAQPPYEEFLTVTPRGADKGAALITVAGALGVDMPHTIAFGDSDNDVAMLELAGHAVQVGTLPLLRQHADTVLSGPDALGGYLDRLADRLTGAVAR